MHLNFILLGLYAKIDTVWYKSYDYNVMNVDFKLVTYNEQIENEEQNFLLIRNRNRSAYYPTKSAFIYEINSKTIYDVISWKNYRTVDHEIILSYHNFHFISTEPDNFIRFEYNTAGCYNIKCQYTNNYTHNELGIAGLSYSWLYYDIVKLQQRTNKLKSYDLNIIESYVEYLKKEQNEIRQHEINLNLPKELRKKRRFNI